MQPGIEGLFDVLGAIYGAKFADAYRSSKPEVMKTVWREALRGFSPDEIARGVAACHARPWPPTLPEFLLLCRPPLEAEAAYWEAREQISKRERWADRWSSPAIFHAAVAVGFDTIKTTPFEKIRARWEHSLKRAQEGIAAGCLPNEVKPRPPAITYEHKGTPMPQKLREKLASFRFRLPIPTTPEESTDAA